MESLAWYVIVNPQNVSELTSSKDWYHAIDRNLLVGTGFRCVEVWMGDINPPAESD